MVVKINYIGRWAHTNVKLHFLYMVQIFCYQRVLKTSDCGLTVMQLAPNLENISNIYRTASLALIIMIMKQYHANPGVIRTKNGAATAAPVKHKYYSFTIIIIMYYLKAGGLFTKSTCIYQHSYKYLIADPKMMNLSKDKTGQYCHLGVAQEDFVFTMDVFMTQNFIAEGRSYSLSQNNIPPFKCV